MADNKIGGFFVSLGMKIDQSFKAGEDAVSKFIGTAGKATAAAVGIAKAVGSVENSNLKMAKAIGISVEDLKAWNDAASKAGISGSALTSSMASLENKMQKLKLGEIDQGLAKNLGMLGIGYDQFANMDATQRMSSVFSAARGMEDQRKAATLVGETLGSAAREYYDWLALSGSTLSKELSEAKMLNYTTEESARAAARFNAEFNAISNSFKNIGLLIGSEIGEALTPVTAAIKDYIAVNREFISSGIIGVFDVLGRIAKNLGIILMNITGTGSISEALEAVARGFKTYILGPLEKLTNLLKPLASAIHALFSGDWSKLGSSLLDFVAGSFNSIVLEGFKGIKELIFGPEETPEPVVSNATEGSNAYEGNRVEKQQKAIQAQKKDKSVVENQKTTTKNITGAKSGPDRRNAALSGTRKANDGIIKPDGTLTQVAPDDWVFAARNLTDLASAFIPHGVNTYTGGATEYSIVQEFTFNGTSRDMAGQVMRQAYKGTQCGLMAAMNKGAQRMQLIPGTR